MTDPKELHHRDAAPAFADVPTNVSGHRAVRRWLVVVGATMAGVALAVVVVQLMVWRLPNAVSATLGMAMTALTASALSVATFRRRTVWAGPTERLVELLPKVRAGELPIDALATIGGGLTPVIPVIQDLLHDVRTERAKLNELNGELRDRVERRTNVLERRLGTLYRQATLDPLTGLRNRRLMDKALPRLVEHARSSGTELGVLMIDVDHFKSLNDTRGHQAGDDFLRNLGQLIKSGIHDERDLAFRVGGDEFVIARTDTTPAACKALADRLVGLSEALGRTYQMPLTPKFSVGWAVLSEAGEMSCDALLALADKRLYLVKGSRPGVARAS